ncbi:MAG: Gfo/Idh/MocA family oxidoreductase [Firmicutes bacterium]|nr:Gfo/Idh/MocA family oxidoreductase [Bacillota bacterium]
MQISDLKVLILGCGSIGKRHADVLTGLGVTDITAYDPVKSQLDKLIELTPNVKDAESYEKALAEKPDAVFILTPTRLHLEHASQAIKAGCNVFLEKPLSDSMKGVEEFEQLVKKSGKKVMVGFCFRYHEGVLRMKKMVEEGVIGDVVSIRAMMGEHFPDVRPDYKEIYYAKHSGAFELIHDLDLAIWLGQDEIEKVYGVYGPFSNIGIEAPDTVEILMKFASAKVATVHLDFFQTPRRRELELIGNNGTMKLSFGSWDEYTLTVYDRDSKQSRSFTAPTKRNDMFADEDREFLESIITGNDFSCTVAEAIKSLKVVHEVTGGVL